MAYINCKKCGCQMSDKSEACPMCGTPVGEEPVSNSVEGISNGQHLDSLSSTSPNTFIPPVVLSEKKPIKKLVVKQPSKATKIGLVISKAGLALAAILIAFFVVRGKKQQKEMLVVEQEAFQNVEEMPAFPGGEAKLMEYISTNINYPQRARKLGIQGRVFVGFVVEPDGSVSNVKLLRGIDSDCDEEAMRVIKSLPKWKPGKQHGKPVRVYYQLPIFFKPN